MDTTVTPIGIADTQTQMHKHTADTQSQMDTLVDIDMDIDTHIEMDIDTHAGIHTDTNAYTHTHTHKHDRVKKREQIYKGVQRAPKFSPGNTPG